MPILVLLAAILLLIFGGSSTGESHVGVAKAERLLTVRDTGASVRLARSDGAQLNLPHRWREPALHGSSVRLTPIAYLRDPGFDGWTIEPVRKGVTTITSTGPSGRRFRVTIRVA